MLHFPFPLPPVCYVGNKAIVPIYLQRREGEKYRRYLRYYTPRYVANDIFCSYDIWSPLYDILTLGPPQTPPRNPPDSPPYGPLNQSYQLSTFNP